MTAAQPTPSLFAALRRFWWVVLLFAMLAGGLGFFASGLQETKYEASAKILVDQAQNQGLFSETQGTQPKVDPIRRLFNEAERMESPEVLRPAAAALGGGLAKPELLASRVSAVAAPEFDLVRVTGTAETAEEAARIANAVVEAYTALITGERQQTIEKSIALQEDVNRRLQDEVGQIATRLRVIQQETAVDVQRTRLPTLVAEEISRRLEANPEFQQLSGQRDSVLETINLNRRKIEQDRINAQLLQGGTNVYEPARPPPKPVQPRPTRNAAVAAVFGLLAGAGIAWWQADRLAPAGTAGAADVLGAPELGELPAAKARARREPIDLSASSETAGAGRTVAAALSYRVPGEGRTVLVTGLHPSSGRSLAVLAVAVALARMGRKVLLIDADPGEGALSELFSMQGSKGFDDLARGMVDADEVIAPVEVPGVSGIDLLPAGAPASDFLTQGAAEDARDQVSATATRYDLVLIDAPPLSPSPVALELSSLADAVMLVIPADVSAGELGRARDRLRLIGAKVAGFVTNHHGLDSQPLHIMSHGVVADRRRTRELNAGPRALPEAEASTEAGAPPQAEAPPTAEAAPAARSRSCSSSSPSSDWGSSSMPAHGSPRSAMRAGTVASVRSSGWTSARSSQRSGQDTVACGRARTHHAPKTVLCGAFWLKSTKTRSPRCSFHQAAVRISGRRRSSSRATATAAERTA